MDQSPAAAAQRLAFKKQVFVSAVSNGNTETVIDLLDRGISIDTKDDEGMSLLHLAAMGGHVTTMRLLIRRGCDVDSVDSRGCTPLHWAAAMGQTKAVRELIRKGASKSVVAGSCGTPLNQAFLNEHVDTVVAMLGEGCPLDTVDSAGATILHSTAEGGNVDSVKELVGRGCDVNAVKANSCTPLHFDAGRDGTEAIRELIKLGTTKPVVADIYDTPFNQAAIYEHVETAVAMLEEESLYDIVNNAAANILHCVAEGGNVNLVIELVGRGPNVNVMKANSCTSLSDTAVPGETEAVYELIVEKSVVGGSFGTPLHLAAITGHVETVVAMLEEGCCSDVVVNDAGATVLHLAAASGNVDLVRELVVRGCDVNAMKANGCTPLHDAATHGRTEAVCELIKLGAAKSVVGGHCGTPLHQAALNGHVETAVAMLKEGCPLNVVPSQLPSSSGSTGDIEETRLKLSWPPAKRRRTSDAEDEPSLRKRSPEGALQDRPTAKRVVRCTVTRSEGVVAAERRPPICEADEAALKRLCWIPFDIKTVSIEAKGGILCLEPTSDDIQVAKEDTIFVEVPPDAVSTSADVKMRYAIIPSGPFTLPEGYQFGSPVVYIHYDGQRVTKPLALHLPHWYGGENHARDGLSFAIAPHSLEKDTTAYQFQLVKGGTFPKHQQFGTFYIDGHSSLFADVFKEETTSVYLATQWEQRLANKTHTKIVITYRSHVWLEIVTKFWERWKLNEDTLTEFMFARYPMSTVCGQLSSSHGQGWKATLAGAVAVNQDNVDFRKRYSSEEDLEQWVVRCLYPPSIHCTVTYSRPPDFGHVSLETLEVVMTGTDRQQVTFPVEVFQAKAVSPAPVGSITQSTQTETSSDLVAHDHIQATPATLVQVIQEHAEQFLEEMNSKVLAPHLKGLGLIPAIIENNLQSKSKKEANSDLLQHLKEDADMKSVMDIFRIASQEQGYGRMNTFAHDVLTKLQQLQQGMKSTP